MKTCCYCWEPIEPQNFAELDGKPFHQLCFYRAVFTKQSDKQAIKKAIDIHIRNFMVNLETALFGAPGRYYWSCPSCCREYSIFDLMGVLGHMAKNAHLVALKKHKPYVKCHVMSLYDSADSVFRDTKR